MAGCWTTPAEEMNFAKLSLFMIDSYAETTVIHLILLIDHWLFSLRKVQQIPICKRLLSSWGAHCFCFVQSESQIGNTQYLWLIVRDCCNDSKVSSVLHISNCCCSIQLVQNFDLDVYTVKLQSLNLNNFLQCNQLIEGCHIFLFVAKIGQLSIWTGSE